MNRSAVFTFTIIIDIYYQYLYNFLINECQLYEIVIIVTNI